MDVNVEDLEGDEGIGEEILDTTVSVLEKITDSVINGGVTVTENTVESVIEVANKINIKTSPETIKAQEEKSQTASKIVQSVETLVSKVSLEENTQFSTKTESVSVAAIKPSAITKEVNCKLTAKFVDGVASAGTDIDITTGACLDQPITDSTISIALDEVPENQSVWFIRFSKDSSLFASNINPDWDVQGDIVGAGIGEERHDFADEGVKMTIYTGDSMTDQNALCQYWDMSGATAGWSSEGMTLIEKTDTYITCESTHLTNFAVLLNPSDTIFTGNQLLALNIITIAGCALSMIGLLLTIIGLSVFKQFRKVLTNKVHIGLALSLLLSYLFLLIGLDQTRYEGSCYFFSIVMHYFFLSAFCWMLCEGINLYLLLVVVFDSHSKLLLKFSLFSTRSYLCYSHRY